MILDFIISLFTGIVDALVSLLPMASLPTELNTALTSFFGTAYAYNSIFPVDTLFQVLGWTMTILVAISLWQGIKYVISLIRGN